MKGAAGAGAWEGEGHLLVVHAHKDAADVELVAVSREDKARSEGWVLLALG
jgi:hypothetical protein